MKMTSFATLVFSMLVVARFVAAQSVPALINYQGQIQNPNGTIPPTADYELSFRIYDAAQGGTLIWGPQIFDGTGGPGKGAKVPVVQGYFNVLLGQVDTLNRSIATALSNNTRFLEIKVGTSPPVTPRQQLLSSPFAIQAENAAQAANSQKLAGFDWSDLLDSNNPRTGKLSLDKLVSRIPGTNLASGAVSLSSGVSGGVNIFVTTNDFPTFVPPLEITVTTSGRPVMLGLTAIPVPVPFNGRDRTYTSYVAGDFFGPDGTGWAVFSLYRGTNEVGRYYIRNDTAFTPPAPIRAVEIPASSISFIDFPPAGNHTYRLMVNCDRYPNRVEVSYSRLYGFEF